MKLLLVLISMLSFVLMPSGCTSQPSPQQSSPQQSSPAATSPVQSPKATIKPSPVPEPTVTATPKPAPSNTPAPTAAPAPRLSVETVVKNMDIPWALDFAPDGRIFITERTGSIRIVKSGQLQPEPWLTLDVAAVGEGGLLGLALDPRFAENRYVYVAYTYHSQTGNLQNKLVRLRENPLTGKGAIDITLLDGAAGGSIHDGGRVKFGPDGKVYWTMGEAGNAQIAQSLSSLNGKILRINPDGTIPDDNPFKDSPIYSYGNRNPQGLAWQPGTGRLYETEHGPSGGIQGFAKDEVNYIEPGKNYGWPVIAGNETQGSMVSPVLQSGNDTWAPSGAAFITGGAWDGSFIFAGLRGESLYRLVMDRSEPRKVITFEKYLTGQYGRLRDVVQGPDGAIYILTSNLDGRGLQSADDDRMLRLLIK